jgi:hypothetical protein
MSRRLVGWAGFLLMLSSYGMGNTVAHPTYGFGIEKGRQEPREKPKSQ